MLIHDAEKALDYRRVMVSMLEFEQGDRHRAKHRRLAIESRSFTSSGTSSIRIRSTKPVNSIATLAVGLRKAGATKEQLVAMFEALKKNGK